MTTSRAFVLAFFACCLVGASVSVAQNYKCDWSVNGIGGGDMAGSAYKCGATAGQTAAGLVTSSNYWALLGFWQPEGQVGVREQESRPSEARLVTRLNAPQPNPFRQSATISYSLSATTRASLQVHDLAGRVVRTLANSVQNPGRYSLRWNGRDNRGRLLSRGVYFVKLTAGTYQATRKMVVE